jgi:hypothetical protein
VEFEVGEQVEPADDFAVGGLGLGEQPFHFLAGEGEVIEILGVNPGESFTGFVVVRVLFELTEAVGGQGGGILRRRRLQRFQHESHPIGILADLDPMRMDAIGEGFARGEVRETLAGEVGRLGAGKELRALAQRGAGRLGILSAMEVPFGNLVQRGRDAMGLCAPIGDPLFEDLNGAVEILLVRGLDIRQQEGAGVITWEGGELPMDFGDCLGVAPPFACAPGRRHKAAAVRVAEFRRRTD